MQLTTTKTKLQRTPSTKPVDKETGVEITDQFQRFNQKNDIYNRCVWDANIKSEKATAFFESHLTPLSRPRKTEGYTSKDFSLRNAAWHLADFISDLKEEEQDRREGFLDAFSIYRPGSETRLPVDTPEKMSAEIKQTATFFGADLTGICDYDERWVYSKKYSRRHLAEKAIDLPDSIKFVIVIAREMDFETIKTGPSALSSAASGYGYSQDILTLLSLAQYIRNLGYQAVASLNDTALDIPLAIQAGLGEYGRNGLLITKEFGPRVRLGKIFTDLPLVADKPVKFGVKKFCNICRECANACPIRAIPFFEPSERTASISSIKGVKKWSILPEKCFTFWANQNTDCSICIRACPYNKIYEKWYFRLGRFFAGTCLRRMMLSLQRIFNFGARIKPHQWWNRQSPNK